MRGKNKLKKVKLNDFNQINSEGQSNENGQKKDKQTPENVYRSLQQQLEQINGFQTTKKSKDQMSKQSKFDNARQMRRAATKSFTEDIRRLNMLEKALGVENHTAHLFCQQSKQQVVKGANSATPIPLNQQAHKANVQISSDGRNRRCFSEYQPSKKKQTPCFPNLQLAANQNYPASNTIGQPQYNPQEQVYQTCQPMSFGRIPQPENAENTTQIQYVMQPTNSYLNQVGLINATYPPIIPASSFQQQRQEQQIPIRLSNQPLLANNPGVSFNNYQCALNPQNQYQYYPPNYGLDHANLANNTATIHHNQPAPQTGSQSTNHYSFISQPQYFLKQIKQINQCFSKLPKPNMFAEINTLKIKDLRNFHQYFASLIYNMKVIQINLAQMKAYKEQTYQKFRQINKKGMDKLVKLKTAYSQQLQFKSYLHQKSQNLNLISTHLTTLQPVATAYFQKKQHTFYNPDQGVILIAEQLRQKFKKLKRQSQQAIKVRSKLSQVSPNLPQLLQDLIQYLQNNALRLDILQKKMSKIRNLFKSSSQGQPFAQLQLGIIKKIDEKWRFVNLLVQLTQLLEMKSKKIVNESV